MCSEAKKTLSSLPIVDLCLSIDTKGEFYWRVCGVVCTRSARFTDGERFFKMSRVGRSGRFCSCLSRDISYVFIRKGVSWPVLERKCCMVFVWCVYVEY